MRVAVEGIDGVGKSTVIAHLRDLLAAQFSVLTETMAPVTLDLLKRYGRDVFGAPSAYWTAVSRRTRTQVFLTEGVCRAEYLRSHYEACDVVMHDRWWQTYLAYSDDEGAEFDHRCRFLRDRLPQVDVVFLLTGDPVVCAQRLRADGDWLAEQMPADRLAGFLDGLQSRYRAIFRGDDTCTVLDGAGRSPEELASAMLGHVAAALQARSRNHARGTGHQPPAALAWAKPGQRIAAIEGIDGAGKSTLARSVAGALPDVQLRRLASASLEMFKAHAACGPSEQASTALRRQFEDEFRHQTYLIDGLVQLACIEAQAGAARTQLFDRWFPLFAIYQDQIQSDRAFFDYLLEQYPTPDPVFYLALAAETAVQRLSARRDWMLDMLGAEETKSALQRMVDQHRPRLGAHAPTATILDAERPAGELADAVRREVGCR